MCPNDTTNDIPQIVPITGTKIRDLTAKIYGRLTVLGFVGVDKKSQAKWVCECECGNFAVTKAIYLTTGKTKSCGCLYRERLKQGRRTHGASATREYKIWSAMRVRCGNPNQPHYERYGGRGIAVCDEWYHNFEHFLADMGPCPGPEYSIDRINNDLGYFPDNCRWATDVEQANNKKSNHILEFQGERLTISQWAKKLGINDRTLSSRIRKGLSVEEVLTIPVKRR